MANKVYYRNNKRKKIVLGITGLCLYLGFISCSGKKSKSYDQVLSYYKSDSLKYLAAKFLINNVKYHYSLKTRYLTNEGKDYTNYVSTYSGKLTASQVIDSLGVQVFTEKLSDSVQVDGDYLIKSIDAAFEAYNSPFESKIHRYPFSIFLNYILPYRVGFEELNDWRSYSRHRYLAYLSTFNLKKMPMKRIYQVINAEQYGTSKFALIKMPHISRPAVNQTIDEILKVRVPFDCEDYAIRSLYALRSLGIACAYEKIPLWGKFNYGHVQESVILENGKFYPILFADTIPFKYQIAKMYRRTFQKQRNPRSEIQKNGEAIQDIPDYFDYSDYVDITKERTDVSDILLTNIHDTNHNVLYLCIYNAGEWKPIEWGKLNKKSKSVVFYNMGRKILYHLASFEHAEVHLINTPFILDTTGVIDLLKKTNKAVAAKSILINNYDRNKPIESNHIYSLNYWDEINHRWVIKEEKKAKSSILIFDNIPIDLLYKIDPLDVQSNDPVRPFTYNGRQIWW